MIPPRSLVISLGMGADGSSTARVQRGPSEAARCASTEDHQAPSPPLFCEQEEPWAILSYPPGATDLDIRTVHVPGFVTQEVPDCADGVIDGSNTSGGDAFGHGGEFLRRRPRCIDGA